MTELIQACLDRGDEDAWTEFVGRFHRVIAATVVKGCRQHGVAMPETIDDLIQETYTKICSNDCRILRDFEFPHPDSAYGLFKTTAYSVVQDHFRNRRAEKRGGGLGEVALDERISSSAHASETIERNVLVAEIRERLEVFSIRDRTIFWMHFRLGMTARAISEIRALELTQKGVESALARITRQLREELAASTSTHSPKGKSVKTSFH